MSGYVLLPWMLGALAGSMLFFAAAVAPTVFRALPAEAAGKFLRALFPRYYLWGFVLAMLTTLTAWLTTAGITIVGVCALVSVLFLYARQILLPQINRARDRELDGDQAAGELFRRLHLQSVVINALQLVMLIGLSIYLVRL